MNYVFSSQEKEQARRQKRNLLLLYFGILAVFLAIVLCVMFIPPREVSRQYEPLFIIINITLTALMGGFTLFFFALKFRLVRHYAKLFRDIDSGLKDETTGVFVEYDPALTSKDGLTFYSLVLDAVPLRREDISIRKVLIEHSRPKPELISGQGVKVITHANILVAWEVV